MSYVAEGWGVGELVLDGDLLVHHEAPRARSSGSVAVRGQTATRHVRLAERLKDYFAGARDDFADVVVDLDGATAFQRALCETLRSVPYGEVVTYGEVAALAGHANAQRAAGTFCANNRFSIVVPCHRVVAATGIGSYGSTGVAYKRRLLELEGAAL